MAMRALWQRGQQGSTRAPEASEGAERACAARWLAGLGMRTRRWSRRRMGLRCEHGHDAKRAEAALRAALNVEVRDALPEGDDGFSGRGGARGCGELQCGTSRCEQCALVAVGEQSIVADAIEAPRQYVQGKAAQELRGMKLHDSGAVAVGIVLVAKAHRVGVEGHESFVGDRHAMGVTPEILDTRPGASPGTLGLNDQRWGAQSEKKGVLRARTGQGQGTP